MAQISLQSRIVYGPVLSRRLGRSLGINLLPTSYKLCSFDCVYCQYGPTLKTTSSSNINDLPTVDQVNQAVEKALKKPRSLDFLTFSGNGEPTLHPQFSKIVQEVSILLDRLSPETKLAILSNSSKVMDPEVVKALNLMDAPMMKLDAGDEITFHAINQPEGSVKFTKILRGLKHISRLIIQSAIINGPISNSSGEAYKSWIDALININPKEIHIYATERPTAKDGIIKVPGKKLKQIEKELISQHSLKVHAY